MISAETYAFLSRVYHAGPNALTKLVIKFYPLDDIAFTEREFDNNFIHLLKECPKVIKDLCDEVNEKSSNEWFYQPLEYKRKHPLIQVNPLSIEHEINSLHWDPNVSYKIMRCEAFSAMGIRYDATTIDCDVTKGNLMWQIINATVSLPTTSPQRKSMFGK